MAAHEAHEHKEKSPLEATFDWLVSGAKKVLLAGGILVASGFLGPVVVPAYMIGIGAAGAAVYFSEQNSKKDHKKGHGDHGHAAAAHH
jgi:hypothetical protein